MPIRRNTYFCFPKLLQRYDKKCIYTSKANYFFLENRMDLSIEYVTHIHEIIMKRSSSKSTTSDLALSLAITLLALPSCKCLDPTISTSTTATSTASTTMDSATVHTRDSIIYRERTIHDTVYITKEVYRNYQISNVNSQ